MWFSNFQNSDQHLILEMLTLFFFCLPFYRYENEGSEMSQLGKGRKDIRHKMQESGRYRLDLGSSDGLEESRGWRGSPAGDRSLRRERA